MPLLEMKPAGRIRDVERPLSPRHPLRLDIERIDRLTCGHEQAVALLAAETDVGAALGQHDAADHRAVGGVNRDPVLGLAAAPCAPEVAVGVDPDSVAAAWLGAAELA